ncbi:RNA-binding protein [Pseudoduganella violacea]|uniref:RNA-binding protein n=1 Tax=Pseudoduganella violacea TaxID=1715466 RepID=A0A7W5FVI2_9BURK|nr:RNA-binding protein [Pseudoduganella violacea]MBB3121025.1 hypothetical protein [Pseudoduganella violacea]
MQIILSGLRGDDKEQEVEAELKRYFNVVSVHFVREGDPDSPWALVEVNDSYPKVWEVTNRLRGAYHRGKRLRFYVPVHQPHPFFKRCA